MQKRENTNKEVGNNVTVGILLVIILVLSIYVSGSLGGYGSGGAQDNSINKSAHGVVGTIYKYVDKNTGKNIEAVISTAGDKVGFYLDTTGNVVLDKVVSASGVKFANKDESIVFWEKGGDLLIIKQEEPVFAGTLIR